ncbi:MAG: succinate dehydrogenase, hydrophobic membrane anchor protein [Burkholderiales bacterium]|nr:succinate dehydrogenase, hydrophobic membrane anchor protein [Burkholderiales bacterium]
MRLFSGQRAFVIQRLCALVLLAYVAAAALRLAFGPPASFEHWRAWAARPSGAVLLLLLAGALIAHAWVGLRDVVLDYVHPLALRLAVLGAAATGLAALAAWTLFILARHAISHIAF